jgi:hypothetical protein
LISVFFDLGVIQEKHQLLFFDIDGSHNVFVLGFRWSRKSLAEDVESTIAPNESDEMIASFFRFPQWMPRCLVLVGGNQLFPYMRQRTIRCFSLELAVAIGAVVPMEAGGIKGAPEATQEGEVMAQ